MAKQTINVIGNKRSKRTDWGFSRGEVLRKDRVYLLSSLRELEESGEHVTQVLKWTGNWGHWLIEWAGVALTILTDPEVQVLTMGPGGRVQIATASGFSEEEVDPTRDGPPYRGMLRDIRRIGNSIYVTGMGRQVYRRVKKATWVRMDEGVLSPKGSARGLGFNSIDGFGADDIYAVGWKGEIWHFDGRVWRQIESPTNLILERVLCVSPSVVYACGQAGVLLRTNGQGWEIVEQDTTEDDFWGMTWFQDHLWLASTDSIFRLENDQLIEVDMGAKKPLTCGWLSANQEVLWSIGSEDLAYYDGNTWSEVILS